MHRNAPRTIDVIGTAAAAATLTAAFAGNTSSAVFARGFKKLGLDVSYTPGANNSYAQIILEYSNEDMNATTLSQWRQLTSAVTATTQTDVYSASGNQMSGASGTPIEIPAPNTAVSGTNYTPHIMPDTDLSANFVRIRIKEVTTGAAGTIYVRLNLVP